MSGGDGGSAAAFNAIDDKVRSLQGRHIALRHPVIVIKAPSKPFANTCLVVAEGYLFADRRSYSPPVDTRYRQLVASPTSGDLFI